MNRLPTETALHDWRYGQTQAERLCAAILHLEGYEDVDPQCPLGGRDGLKDVLCVKAGSKWLGAAYFPPTRAKLSDVTKKFKDDFAGVARNGVFGMVFLTNQHMTPGGRANLIAHAKSTGGQAEIYHVERLRGILDAPKGYGLRLEYLRIPMTEEEQISFFSALSYDVTRRLLENEKHFASLHEKLDLVLKRTQAIGLALPQSPSSITATRMESPALVENPTSTLSIANLCWIHRILTEESGLPEAVRGRLRSVSVLISCTDYSPRPAHEVPSALREFVSWWRDEHRHAVDASKADVVLALAKLHHRFLSIHPFVDGNGRVARVLLDQAARELLRQSVGPEFLAEPGSYFSALASADRGDLLPLTRLIEAALQ